MSFSHLRRRALCCHSVPCLRIQSRLRRLISTPSNVNHIRSSPSSVTSRLKTINNSKTSLDRSEEPVPESTETTQTDYNKLDIFSNTPPPSTAIDACLHNGFVLNNGQKISDGSGVLLIGGEGFLWRPWRMNASVAVSANDEKSGKCSKYNMNSKGQFEIAKEALGLLKAMWPKPDLCILGTGPSTRLLAPETRRAINEMGIRIEVQDTRNAAAQFNLLATERGVETVAAAMIPIGP